MVLLFLPAVLVVGPAFKSWADPATSHRRELFPGITYIRETWTDPRPVSIHIIRVDLTAPGIRLLVTPPDDPAAYFHTQARFTSDFLAEHDLQLAINGAFFEKAFNDQESIFDRMYLDGEPSRVLGLAVSDGLMYALDQAPYVPLYIGPQNEAAIGAPPAEITQAIAGWPLLVWQGENVAPLDIRRDARTAVGLTADGRELLLFVVDGKTEASQGLAFHELADLMITHGVWDGINLDGGGSTTLVMAGDDGLPDVLNVPVGNLIPGSERPVANHLGIYAGGVE